MKGVWATGVCSGSSARNSELRRGEIPGLKTSTSVATSDVEKILSERRDPLGVVYTVEAAEVRRHLESWREAIVKELGSLEELGVIIRHKKESAQKFAKTPNLTIVPGKVVWTVKPPGSLQGSKRFKRKARNVACGNFEAPSEKELFASGASVESLWFFNGDVEGCLDIGG